MNFWNKLPKPFFVLAPMEAVTDVVFRRVISKAGAPDVFFTEFANATGWVHAGDKAIRGRLIKTDNEHPIVAQIWGGEPGDMESFAQHCAKLGFDGIDINMGCPAKSAVKSGGSALIRKPDVAIAAIAAAKTAGLPVSVKTRLGYTQINEWQEWLTVLLNQNIAALIIHLRTKKEMSKVPAHHELIPDIKQLRDKIAPNTLLIINGDIRDRKHGMELVDKYKVDGIMIGRGIFNDPFAFAVKQDIASDREDYKKKLLGLLQYHLEIFDEYSDQTGRPFETLKRFFKIYVKDFPGAKELREKLMNCENTDQARSVICDNEIN